MKVIDLSHAIRVQMPVFPGTEPPLLETANTLQKDGFAEKKITMYSHTGTHMDAPAHMLEGGKTLDDYGAAFFIGKAVLIDCRALVSKEIGLSFLRKFREQIAEASFIIFRTGWDKYWGQEKYFCDYPTLSTKAVSWLTEFNDLRGIGVDTISVDPIDSEKFPVHHFLFDRSLIILENLTNLNKLAETQFCLVCTPLKIEQADGSPVRALALEDIKFTYPAKIF